MKAVLLTHGHFDHIMGIDGFCKVYDVPVYVGEKEAGLILTPLEPVRYLYEGLYFF